MNFSNLPVLYSVTTLMNDKLNFKKLSFSLRHRKRYRTKYTQIFLPNTPPALPLLNITWYCHPIFRQLNSTETLVHSEVELLRFMVENMGMRQVSIWEPVFLCQTSLHKCSQTSIIIPEMYDRSNQSACYHSISPQLWPYVWPGTWSRKI